MNITRYAGMAACIAAVAVCTAARAGETGHYIDGVEGIKGASLPPPGLYGRLYTLYYGADHLRDAHGDKVDPDFTLRVGAVVPRVIWITPWTVLGAQVGCDAIVPILYTDFKMGALGLSETQAGFYDPCLEPILLSWHLPRADVAAGVGLYVPAGQYEPDDPSSPGKGFYSGLFTLGATAYLDRERTWSLSALGRYEINGNKRKVDVQPGDALHIEWGLGKNLATIWEIGLAGYAQWQVTDDRGDDVTWDRSDHDEVYAAGPEVTYAVAPARLNVSLRYVHEFLARDRPEGQVATLTLTKVF